MLLIPAIAASLTLLVPSALGFGGDLTIWVAAGSEIDTVLEVQRETEAKSDIYAITSESAGEHTTTKKGTTFNRLYREDFDSTVSFRPYVFRRGTDEVDGGHETKVRFRDNTAERRRDTEADMTTVLCQHWGRRTKSYLLR